LILSKQRNLFKAGFLSGREGKTKDQKKIKPGKLYTDFEYSIESLPVF
jgi:hypothetical protein